MSTAYLVVALMAIAANAFSGVAAIVHFKPIIPAMARAGVPESWLTFPIGTLKTAGAAGLLAERGCTVVCGGLGEVMAAADDLRRLLPGEKS